MNKNKETIDSINSLVSRLETLKRQLEKDGSFLGKVEKLGKGTWVICNDTYYQYVSADTTMVTVARKGCNQRFGIHEFEENFRIANADEVAQHLIYLKQRGWTQMSDKVFKGFSLKEEFKNNEKIVLAIIDNKGSKLQKYFMESSVEWSKIKRAEIKHWFEKYYEQEIPETNHVQYAEKDFIDPKSCEFYMVTCKGTNGAKMRHTNYNVAVSEAQRIANKENHETWVVGVVKKVNPKY